MAEPLAASRMSSSLAVQATIGPTDDLDGILGARVVAYLFDSILLAILSIAFIGLGFVVLLVKSHGGTRDVSDPALWDFVYVSLAAIPAAAVLTLIMLSKRGQTPGQYFMGLSVRREDGRAPSLGQLVMYLIAMNPLVFHPVLAGFWALLAYISLSLTSSNVLVLGSLGIAILCLLGPVVALISGAFDGGHRGLHDRIAGVMVVRLE